MSAVTGVTGYHTHSIEKEQAIQQQSIHQKDTLHRQAFQTDNSKTEEPPRVTGNVLQNGKRPAEEKSGQDAGDEDTGRKVTGRKGTIQKGADEIDDDDGDDLDDQILLAEMQLALRQAEIRLTILRQRKKRKLSKH
ncbi:hypothetical protein LZ31DRAFT_543295 [Colletotrichum somersetense]|nr:hypothetical protein LZ31DRAFT_543295 [Colletotrichum somersetense]